MPKGIYKRKKVNEEVSFKKNIRKMVKLLETLGFSRDTAYEFIIDLIRK